MSDDMNDDLSAAVAACEPTHNAVAAIASRVLQGRFVCASSNSKLWYSFNGSRWCKERCALGVHRALATCVRQVFLDAAASLVHYSESTIVSLLDIASKLQNDTFKTAVVKVMREYMYDSTFLQRLDSNPDLLGFDNGVFVLSSRRFRCSTPEDLVSLSVGYAYDSEEVDPQLAQEVSMYFDRLHPEAEQRDYVIRTFARQLYGDSGAQLLHVHAGSGANGKTSFFQLMGNVFGNYVQKFGVEVLTAKERPSLGKPMPEFATWKGKRIIYCTEPNCEDKLNSGILKDLSGGELISYRMLYCNDITVFKPQFKIHLMTNDAPRLDGSDQGVTRRVRKIDYLSRFVSTTDVDLEKSRYPKDNSLLLRAASDPRLKLAFAKVFLNAFDSGFDFPMPRGVAQSSSAYLGENDAMQEFVQECLEQVENGFFTLKEAKARALHEGIRIAPSAFKSRLESKLGTECLSQKKIKGERQSNVFLGWRLKELKISAGE